ncbi:ATP phosphoribosyltransferase regulatory subunit [hydrothermal vent metagenome]|uniref:ATP phosphoribosyltransferase regulatory subunit n=1 Tax=hydrothermal vent metagenome TaxID=652676 RepID=A0A3B1C3D3_9ZZZZ
MKDERWLLPEGIEEVLPRQARALEGLRRRLLDIYDRWGYEQVMPPFIEYLESLLTGTGNDLDLQTFKLTDQLSGRMMGIRADMTPQVSRIAACHLQQDAPVRLCYMGSVIRTRPDSFASSRSPLQLGAELYGHSGVESDIEILGLMIETLHQSGIAQPYIDLGHVGIYRGLATQAGLSQTQEATLFDALQRKARPEIEACLTDWNLDDSVANMLLALVDLNGGDEVLEQAKEQLQNAVESVNAALENLAAIAAGLRQQQPQLNLHYDLAELRGYHYHTGLVFAAYIPGRGLAIAQGGRYDDIGEVFGNARPATGFSTDLKVLLETVPEAHDQPGAIFAPPDRFPELMQFISELRGQGERVIQALPGQKGGAAETGCEREIVKDGKGWIVREL